MPKRGGLGKRGLDLLISASGGKGNADPDTGNPGHSDSLKDRKSVV